MLEFTCPKCGKNRIEEVMADVVQYAEITDIDEETFTVDYENTKTDGGNVEFYQCMDCGWQIEFEDEEKEEINNTELLVEYLKEQKK